MVHMEASLESHPEMRAEFPQAFRTTQESQILVPQPGPGTAQRVQVPAMPIRNWMDGNTQRVAFHSSMPKWRPVMNGVPQRSVLGLALFDIFVSNMDSGIEGTLRKFANDTELCAAVDILEGRDAI
ncbi:hypothetical protein TURU_077945 [Turdus rufiventris]|nr:hypothetical protein TURU_077945 [Turdus rufiventris]